MTKVWELLDGDYVEPLAIDTDSGKEFRTPDSWWLTAEPIGNFPILRIQAQQKMAEIPDFFRCGMLPLVSERARGILQRLGGFDGEFHPVEVVSADGASSVRNPFWYWRLMGAVDAVDYDASEVEFFPGTDRPRRVWKLILLEDRLSGRNAFRLAKMTSIFVSESFRSACLMDALSMKFKPVSEFRLGW